MPVRYTAEVRHAGRDVHVTMRVTVQKGPYRAETLRVGKGFFQPRLWSETIAPLLWASGWVITTADGEVLDPAKLDVYVTQGPKAIEMGTAWGPDGAVVSPSVSPSGGKVPENTGKHPVGVAEGDSKATVAGVTPLYEWFTRA